MGSRTLKGNLRFPLDFTYHGCFPNPQFQMNHVKRLSLLQMKVKYARAIALHLKNHYHYGYIYHTNCNQLDPYLAAMWRFRMAQSQVLI